MKLRNTLVLVVIALALGAVVLFVEPKAPAPAEPGSTPTPTPIPELLSLDVGAVHEVRVAREATVQVTTVVRGEADGWRVIEPMEDDADSFRITGFIDTLATVRPRRVLTGALDLAEFGLAPAEMVVTLVMQDGGQRVVEFGAMNADSSAYYARLGAEEGTVYLVPSYVGADAERLLNEPPIAPTPMPTPAATIPPPPTPPGS